MARIKTRFGVVVLSALLSATFVATSSAQERSRGISIHQMPKRASAFADAPWGLAFDGFPGGRRDQVRPVFQTADSLISFFHAQNATVQSNGIWIVVTHPDAYSDEEKALLEEVKARCRAESIPLFICRASELPDGWTRYDR